MRVFMPNSVDESFGAAAECGLKRRHTDRIHTQIRRDGHDDFFHALPRFLCGRFSKVTAVGVKLQLKGARIALQRDLLFGAGYECA